MPSPLVRKASLDVYLQGSKVGVLDYTSHHNIFGFLEAIGVDGYRISGAGAQNKLIARRPGSLLGSWRGNGRVKFTRRLSLSLKSIVGKSHKYEN